MKAHHPQQHPGRTLRAFMAAAAAICVLGLASLVFLHAPDTTIDSLAPAAEATDLVHADALAAPIAAWTSVPSAESVFRDKGYVAPEPPIAQF